MSKEILLVVESVSNEKGVSEEIIFDALEVAVGRELYIQPLQVVAVKEVLGEATACIYVCV